MALSNAANWSQPLHHHAPQLHPPAGWAEGGPSSFLANTTQLVLEGIERVEQALAAHDGQEAFSNLEEEERFLAEAELLEKLLASDQRLDYDYGQQVVNNQQQQQQHNSGHHQEEEDKEDEEEVVEHDAAAAAHHPHAHGNHSGHHDGHHGGHGDKHGGGHQEIPSVRYRKKFFLLFPNCQIYRQKQFEEKQLCGYTINFRSSTTITVQYFQYKPQCTISKLTLQCMYGYTGTVL